MLKYNILVRYSKRILYKNFVKQYNPMISYQISDWQKLFTSASAKLQRSEHLNCCHLLQKPAQPAILDWNFFWEYIFLEWFREIYNFANTWNYKLFIVSLNSVKVQFKSKLIEPKRFDAALSTFLIHIFTNNTNFIPLNCIQYELF